METKTMLNGVSFRPNLRIFSEESANYLAAELTSRLDAIRNGETSGYGDLVSLRNSLACELEPMVEHYRALYIAGDISESDAKAAARLCLARSCAGWLLDSLATPKAVARRLETPMLAKHVSDLIKVNREQGASAAQAHFSQITQSAKVWEARAIREAFQEALEGEVKSAI